MKYLIAAVICSCIALVYSETCTSGSVNECTLTLCGNNTLICEHGECTCQQASTSGNTGDIACSTLNDCIGLPHCHGDGIHGPSGPHGHEWHCIDGICRCAGYHP